VISNFPGSALIRALEVPTGRHLEIAPSGLARDLSECLLSDIAENPAVDCLSSGKQLPKMQLLFPIDPA
jgi:hypothetical protein